VNGALTPDAWPHGERRHRVLTDDDAEAIAEHMTEKLIERISDERVAGQVIAVWSRHLDQQIGRGVRRLVLWIGLALIGAAAVKFEIWSKFIR